MKDPGGGEGGNGHREDDPEEDLQVRCAVDSGRLLDLEGEGGEEISHEQNDPREAPRRVEEDQGELIVDEVEVDHDLEDRNGHHLRGDRHEQDDREE